MTGLSGIPTLLLIVGFSATCGIYALYRRDTLIKSREVAIAWTGLTVFPILAGVIWFASKMV